MTDSKTQSKEAPKLMPHRCNLAEYERETHRAYPEVGTTKEQVLEPEYWAHLAKKFRPGSKIEVFAEDGTYYGELLILACDRAWAKTHVLSWHSLTNADVSLSQSGKFSAEYKGPVKKHCIVRVSDGELLHQGAQTKDAALQWLAENASTVS